MNTFLTILLIIAALLALLLLIAAFIKKRHYVKREIIINAPLQKVFNFLRLLKNQELFNQWAAEDPDRKKEFKGTDGTVGYIYSWSGNKKAGQGEKEIIDIVEGKRIETEIRFVKPMAVKASAIMETEAVSANQTKVYLINTGTLPYPMNIMIPIAETNFGKQMEGSLIKLKDILERNTNTPAANK